jgi:hypothetical protein
VAAAAIVAVVFRNCLREVIQGSSLENRETGHARWSRLLRSLCQLGWA